MTLWLLLTEHGHDHIYSGIGIERNDFAVVTTHLLQLITSCKRPPKVGTPRRAAPAIALVGMHTDTSFMVRPPIHNPFHTGAHKLGGEDRRVFLFFYPSIEAINRRKTQELWHVMLSIQVKSDVFWILMIIIHFRVVIFMFDHP